MYRKYVLLSILLSAPVYAGNYGDVENSIAREAASCAAYFTAISKMPGLSSDHREQSQDLNAQSYLLSSKLTNKGLAGVRVELALAEIVETLHKVDVNWSVIIDRHDNACRALIHEYQDRIRFWRNEYLQEPNTIKKAGKYGNA